MKPSFIINRFEKSKDITKKAKKQIWQVFTFLMIVASLLYYICTRTLDMVEFRGNLVPAGNVMETAGDGDDFFAEFRLSREKIQKEQMDLVKKVMDDKNASAKVRDEAHLQYLEIVDAMGKELKIEGVLKAKGWDTLVFLSGDLCTVVVKASELDEKDVAQIGDAVKKIGRINVQNITIIPAPD
ncbi:MAG TPA: SpoIIIAH-like family protein [Firmicutes bacterium]|nr:SpoIIIAH-like family protein [Bacillota bacterium]